MKYLCHLTQARWRSPEVNPLLHASGLHAPASRATSAMCYLYDRTVNEAIALICTVLGA